MKENIYLFEPSYNKVKRKIKSFTRRNFIDIPQLQSSLPPADYHAINIVSAVLPFKVNNYVVDELIDWSDPIHDPIFRLTFPQKEMLSEEHFQQVESVLKDGRLGLDTKKAVAKIRLELNPHPAGQNKNVPQLEGIPMKGIQHKYRETVLFFPSSGQTCHAYCTFCFRWPQFTGMEDIKFAMNESQSLVNYVARHPEVSDILFTGGDPMIMSAAKLEGYVNPILDAHIPHLQTIRIGSKSLSYWPYRFLSDPDADDILRLFERIVKQGLNLAFMAHFNHPKELSTPAVEKAIRKIQNTGAIIRTQSPILNHINKDASIWKEMWKKQVQLGCVPYYMFVARDTGAQKYFAVSLEEAWKIYRDAYQGVSGIARTVRGPSMSADPGKIQILGIQEIKGNKFFILRFLQARQHEKVGQPFFAAYDPKAIWWDDLKEVSF